MIQPNAGLPLLEDGQTVYPMKVDEFIEAIVPLVKKGIAIVGGCCGTTPEFIQKLKKLPNNSDSKRSFFVDTCLFRNNNC